MIYLEIKAVILFNKLHEFNQSKISFFGNLQNIEGYMGFTEKQGDTFQLQISWDNQESYDTFIISEHYRVFRGAITTLSRANSIRIFKKD